MTGYTDYTVRVYESGYTEWRKNGELHREDGPAFVWANGDKFWYLNGKPHREDGPAVEYADGSKAWWLKGKLNRKDGPALECVNGYKEWWLNGEELTEEEFNARNMYIKDIVSDIPVMTFNSEPSVVEDVTVTLLGEEHVIPAARHPNGAFEAAMLAVALKLHQRLEELERKSDE